MDDLKILTDKEINDFRDDTIDFGSFARTLKRIIISAETPITIGIYGDWGAGKTSLMRLTQKLLVNEAETIWFNAWKYDSVYDLRVALIKIILAEMGRDPLIGLSFVIWKSQEFLQAPDMID